MYVWLIDVKNDVNARLRELGRNKPHYPKSRVDQMYKPLLDLTTEQIFEDRESSMTAETMDRLHKISFAPDDREGPDEDPTNEASEISPLSAETTNSVIGTNKTAASPAAPPPCKVCGAKKASASNIVTARNKK
jgi:hypothetical protein